MTASDETILADLRALQDREQLRDRHLVWIGEAGFVLAHTDHERSLADADLKDLEDCPIHRWLNSRDYLVVPLPGVYRVVRRLGEVPGAPREYELEPAAVMV